MEENRSGSNGSVLVAGDIMLDIYRFGNVNRISPEAPVPVFSETGKHKSVPGGAANVAVNMAAIGMKTALFSLVGSDAAGDALLESLQKLEIDVSAVKRSPERRTTSKLRFIGPNNQQILRVDMEETEDMHIKDVEDLFYSIERRIREFGLMLLSDYKKGFLSEEISKRLVELGRKNNIPVLVDVKDVNISKYKGAYLLKPNRKELGELTGMPAGTIDDVEKAAIKLCENAECSYVLTTLGADGMLLVNKDGKLAYSKSTAKEVYDVTGAGDTSIAYLAADILQGKSIYEAVETANYAAGVQVSKLGTSIVYPYEVERAMGREAVALNRKLLDYYRKDGLERIADDRRNGKKAVFTNGCFDILHAGHISYLKRARELGDFLVVGVNSDASVRRLKGESRPINSLADRCLVLSALEFVDYVVPFEEDTPNRLIKAVLPDVLVKGGDYNIEEIVGKDIVEANGGIVTTVSFVPGKSTTGIVDRVVNGNDEERRYRNHP